MIAVLRACLLVFAGCWLVLAAANAGGWPRFVVAVVICLAGVVVLSRPVQ